MLIWVGEGFIPWPVVDDVVFGVSVLTAFSKDLPHQEEAGQEVKAE
jgi:hypothetical protein